jgi:hypothetical protein
MNTGNISWELVSVRSTPIMFPINAPMYGIRFNIAKITPIKSACFMPKRSNNPPKSTMI